MPVHHDLHDGVLTLTLDEPASRNALGAATLRDLREAVAGAAARTDVRVLVLSHTGPVFCSGMDLRETDGATAAEQPVIAFPALLAELVESPVPVIARVGGKARAGGIGLLAACDLAVAAASADFAFTEVRLGLAPAVISAVVLPRMAPAAAHALFLTGQTFDATRAAAAGLLDVVVDDPALEAEVARYALLLAGHSPAALAETKALLRRPRGSDLRAELAVMSELSARLFASPDGQEGMAAFREKRRPMWST